jgi:hypothetical protein
MLLRQLTRRNATAIEMPDNPTDEEIKVLVEQMFIDSEASNYRRLKGQARHLRRQERRTRSRFEKRLMRRWRSAIDLYDLVLIVTRQLGQDLNEAHRPQAVEDQDYVFEALTRIHARSCLIASEIRALMITGHASGALARWRSLHELAVVAYFVKEHGNEVAERYMLHEVIQVAKQSDRYEVHHEALNHEPQDPIGRQEILDARRALITRFGAAYAKDYGWVGGALSGIPTFERIEESVGLAHWRPYFGMASQSVHAGFRGMTNDIGQMSSVCSQQVMLAGPSNAGLAEPGQSAVIALANCTIALLSHVPRPESVIGMKVLQRLVEETSEAFMNVQRNLERDEVRYGNQRI